MIWLFVILQLVFISAYWWVYQSYFMQPNYNQPQIFWNPITRSLLTHGIPIGIIGLVIAAFAFTHHPWLFLLLTVVWWFYNGRKQRNNTRDPVMPTMTGNGLKIDTFTTEDLLEDIRLWREEIPNNQDSAHKNTGEN